MPFISLPVEILVAILDSLHEIDLLQFTVVSKQLRKIVNGSSKLQYTIELTKRRMTCLVPTSDELPYASRLEGLRNAEHAWRKLNWRGKYNFKLPPAGSIYDFAGGIYALGKENTIRQLTGSISFIELPSTVDTPQLRTWSCFIPDLTIVDFTIDQSQDLLVLVVLNLNSSSSHLYDIHLRSLTTGDVHPLASLAKIPCLSKAECPAANPFSVAASVRVQIMGDLIGLLAREMNTGPATHLEIWDWINNPHVSCKLNHQSGIEDFTFLSHDALLLVRPEGSFGVYTIPHPITENSIPAKKYRYMFPTLSPDYIYWYINISVSLCPKGGCHSSIRKDPEKQLYCPNAEDRIVVCTLYIFDPAEEDMRRLHCFVFFVTVRSLLYPPKEWIQACTKEKTQKHASIPEVVFPQRGSQSQSLAELVDAIPPSFYTSNPQTLKATPPPSIYPVKIPWDVWGPPSTRWFQECIHTDWQHSVYGMRTVDSTRPAQSLRTPGQEEVVADVPLLTSRVGPEIFLPGQPQVLAQDEDPTEPSPVIPEHTMPPRHLRLRDYNPYTIWELEMEEQEQQAESESSESRGKEKTGFGSWGIPRVVREATVTDVHGLFIHDVESRLPYVEVLSKETFEMTDVMMDDRRVLLFQRGEAGVLNRVNVLTM